MTVRSLFRSGCIARSELAQIRRRTLRENRTRFFGSLQARAETCGGVITEAAEQISFVQCVGPTNVTSLRKTNSMLAQHAGCQHTIRATDSASNYPLTLKLVTFAEPSARSCDSDFVCSVLATSSA